MKKMKALQIIAAAMVVTVAATSTPVHVLHMERQVQTAHYFQIHRIFQIIIPGRILYGIKRMIREISSEKANLIIQQELF